MTCTRWQHTTHGNKVVKRSRIRTQREEKNRTTRQRSIRCWLCITIYLPRRQAENKPRMPPPPTIPKQQKKEEEENHQKGHKHLLNVSDGYVLYLLFSPSEVISVCRSVGLPPSLPVWKRYLVHIIR